MSGSGMVAAAGALIAEKAIAATLDYTLDYTTEFEAGEAITGSVWTAVPNDLTLSGGSYTGATATIKCEGGTDGTWYTVENVATTNLGYAHAGAFRLFVSDPAQLATGMNLPLPAAQMIGSLRRDRLMVMAANYFPGVGVDDDYLLQQLNIAVKAVEHDLRTFLTPREVLPNSATQAEIDALTMTGAVVELEAALDYDPALFQGNTWGHIETRKAPIIDVHSIKFDYPTPNNTLYTIPNEWIRVDKKYGQIHLVPVQTSIMLPLNAFLLSALGGGRTVPQMLEVRYSAGLINCARDWPDIIDIVLKKVALAVLENQFIPSSTGGSVSADGLSQSNNISLKMDDYETIIARKMKAARSALFGVRMMVV